MGEVSTAPSNSLLKLMLNSALIFGFSSRRKGGIGDPGLSHPPAGTGCQEAALGAAAGRQNGRRLPLVALFPCTEQSHLHLESLQQGHWW